MPVSIGIRCFDISAFFRLVVFDASRLLGIFGDSTALSPGFDLPFSHLRTFSPFFCLETPFSGPSSVHPYRLFPSYTSLSLEHPSNLPSLPPQTLTSPPSHSRLVVLGRRKAIPVSCPTGTKWSAPVCHGVTPKHWLLRCFLVVGKDRGQSNTKLEQLGVRQRCRFRTIIVMMLGRGLGGSSSGTMRESTTITPGDGTIAP